jgi:regulator of RNase E activity RraA
VTISRSPHSAELHPGAGFRVHPPRVRVAPEVLAGLAAFGSPDVSDLLNRLYAVHPDIRLLAGGPHLCAPVCTVKVFPGDNLLVHKALDLALPGQAVVVDARGGRTNAVLGELVCTKAAHRGIAAFVVDGLVRDLPGIQRLGFTVFARGATPVGPLHRGPGEINVPVVCGGTVVEPGDVVLADEAGMVIVPSGDAANLLTRLRAGRAASDRYAEAVARGEFSNAWVDAILAAGGVSVVEDADGAPSRKRPEESPTDREHPEASPHSDAGS